MLGARNGRPGPERGLRQQRVAGSDERLQIPGAAAVARVDESRGRTLAGPAATDTNSAGAVESGDAFDGRVSGGAPTGRYAEGVTLLRVSDGPNLHDERPKAMDTL